MTIRQYISNQFSTLLGDFWNEFKILIYTLFALLNIDFDIVKVLVVLMCIDTILGSIKAVYVAKYEFTFKKLLWGIVTKSLILLIPMILGLTALGLGYDFRFLIDVVLKIFIVSEAVSALTNILSIRKKKPIENTDFISQLLHNIRAFLIKKIELFISESKK